MQQIRAWLRRVVVVCAAAALVALALEFGFYQAPVPLPLLLAFQLAAVATYLSARAFDIATAGNRAAVLRRYWLDGALLMAGVIAVLLWFELSHAHVLRASTVYVATIQALIFARFAIEAVRLNLALSQSKLHPTRVLAITFASLILFGALALALPRATTEILQSRPDFTIPSHLLNCLFTATSATCVTGLVVYDTGTDFTLFGQLVILVLIQAGGLGIMIFGSVFGLLAGRQLSLKQSLALEDSLSHRTLGEVRRIVVFILIFTALVEAIGAAILFPMWVGPMAWYHRLYLSVFHAISAFCNAGFALQPDSLVSYRRCLGVYTAVMPLIVLGGLGFPVLRDLWSGVVVGLKRGKARRSGLRRTGPLPRAHRFSLHTKLVLATTLLLLVVPTICFLAFESLQLGGGGSALMAGNGVMNSDPWPLRVLDSLFLSATCRTAGFNTILMDAHSLSPASHMLAAILMFIGGSPSSTAGGIKTVVVAVMMLSVIATLRGRSHVETWGRTIPEVAVRRAAVVVTLMFALVSLVTLTLCFTERTTLVEAVFETVSACGTVGLSTGITPTLTVAGRVAIIIAMFAGRLGPLTVLAALAGPGSPGRYEYPTENVEIG